MNKKNNKNQEISNNKKQRLSRWQRILGVIYRILIIFGILSFIAGSFLIIFTDYITRWFLIYPTIIGLIGVILARVEYALYKRLYF